MFFSLLPFMLAMEVAKDNGVYVSFSVQLCMLIAFVGLFVIDVIKSVKK